jgi:hypothetical protein
MNHLSITLQVAAQKAKIISVRVASSGYNLIRKYFEVVVFYGRSGRASPVHRISP